MNIWQTIAYTLEKVFLKTMMTIVVNVGNDNVYCRFRQFRGRIRLVSYRPYRIRLLTVVNDLKVHHSMVYTQLQHDKIGPGIIDLGLLIF